MANIWSPEVEIPTGVAVNNFPATQPVSGTVSVGNFPAVQSVDDNGGSLTIDGTVSVNNFPGASTGTATVTSVSVGAGAAVSLSASNAAKTKVVLYNETGTLFVKLGATASSTSYTYRLTANTTAEINGYYGLITAIKASGTTPVLVTELGI